MHSGWLFLYPKACSSTFPKSVVLVPLSSMTAFTVPLTKMAPSAFLLSLIFLYSVVRLKLSLGFLVYPNTLTNRSIRNSPWYCSSLLFLMFSWNLRGFCGYRIIRAALESRMTVSRTPPSCCRKPGCGCRCASAPPGTAPPFPGPRPCAPGRPGRPGG